jgi:spore germination protein GerM
VADIYWLDPNSDRLVLQAEAIAVNKVSDKASVLKAAFNQLLAGSNTHPDRTTVPANTKLLGLEVKGDGIHLNLSEAFSEGGGSTAMVGRLGQVLYTATSLDRDAPVWIEINGQPLEVLGGEGVEVPQPITRKYFQENFQG